MRRLAAKVDANQAPIVDALRKVGCSVDFWGTDGAPDLVCGYQGATYLLEVKLPLGPKGGANGSELTPDQRKWHAAWRGQVAIVRTPEEALAVVGIAC